jgi:LacI family transcriptional regulator
VKKITIREVAKAANVTMMTVSNVVNNRTDQMSTETREKVRVVIDQLGYKPNHAAKTLRTKSSLSIGMIILDDVPQFLAGTYTSQVVSGLSNFLADRNYSLILQGIRSQNIENKSILEEIHADAICAILSGSNETRLKIIKKILKLDLPFVLIQEKYPDKRICSILQDDFKAGSLISEYLVKKKCKKFIFLSPNQKWPAIEERIRGVINILSKLKLSVEIVDCGDEGLNATKLGVLNYVERAGLPEAIIGGNDKMAMAAIRILNEKGINIPSDVRVTGFNSFETAAYITPSLVTVKSKAYEIGMEAGKVLISAIKNKKSVSNEIILPIEFVNGESA